MSCFNFLSSSSKSKSGDSTNFTVLTTSLGFSGSNGPFYYIKNATIISSDFKTIKFIVKDEYSKEIKFTRCYNTKDFDFKYEHPELEIKEHPEKYPNMCFYINDELIYEQPQHIIVDVEITVSKDSPITDIEEILDINQDQYCDK